LKKQNNGFKISLLKMPKIIMLIILLKILIKFLLPFRKFNLEKIYHIKKKLIYYLIYMRVRLILLNFKILNNY